MTDNESDLNLNNDITPDRVGDILGSTIACDDTNKKVLLYAMLTAYTSGDQLNVCLLGPSSTGKTYLAEEVAKYFPEEDVMVLSGATPTAFRYNLTSIDDDGVGHVNFRHKILIFAEMPNSRVLEVLRSVLSHDRDNSVFLSTAGGANGNRKAQIIQYEGFPSVVFCSANMRLNEQEATRCILLSPESNERKVSESVRMSALRNSNPEEYKKNVEASQGRSLLRQRIRAVRDMNIDTVIIEDPERDVIARYASLSGRYTSSDSRSIRYLMSLIKSIAMLNAENRINPETKQVVASARDIDEGFKLWSEIMMFQGSGLVPAVMNFHICCFLPAFDNKKGYLDGISIDDIIEYCNDEGIPLPGNAYSLAHDFIPVMKAQNLIAETSDPNDRRRKLYRPLESLSEPQRGTSDDHIAPPPYAGPMTRNPGRYDDYGEALSEDDKLDF